MNKVGPKYGKVNNQDEGEILMFLFTLRKSLLARSLQVMVIIPGDLRSKQGPVVKKQED